MRVKCKHSVRQPAEMNSNALVLYMNTMRLHFFRFMSSTIYIVVKKILAVNLFGMLMISIVWAQQTGDLIVPKLLGKEAKARGVKKADIPDAKAGATSAAAMSAAQAYARKINRFNRTMRPLASYNLPPLEDDIHDHSNESVKLLKSPREAYANLPRNKTGNRVDWVAALATGKITPLWSRVDSGVEKMVMDMDILRVTKGTINNVVFPHKQHTEWLVCSNCHPAIFVPHKGANQISMALILSGQKCGVCHGRVAFPPSECGRCHSRKKDVLQP